MIAERTLVLVDNGSLRPEATLGLRSLAARLGRRLGREVVPVSLLHSSGVSPEALGGRAASILEPWLRREAEQGARRFGIIPLFLGPSGAITDYVPARIEALADEFAGLDVAVAPVLSAAAPDAVGRLAAIAADGVRAAIRAAGWEDGGPRPTVVLVDHGTPVPAVSALRDDVAACLGDLLGEACSGAWASSMERREGPEYAFNEPLLARLLRHPSLVRYAGGRVVVSMFFLLPGRHAGPGGDVATIIEEARRECPLLDVRMSPLLGEHHGLLDLLADAAASLPP